MITPDIIERALAGDEQALSLLVEAIDHAARPAIGAVLRRRQIWLAHDAKTEMDDRLQDLLVKLWSNDGKRLREWDPMKGSFEKYIGVIAKRAAIDHYRTPREQLSYDDEDAPDITDDARTPEAQVAKLDVEQKIVEGLRAKLKTEQQRQMFGLLIEQGLTVDEICKQKGMSNDAVHHWREFFKKLANDVRKEIDSDPRP